MSSSTITRRGCAKIGKHAGLGSSHLLYGLNLLRAAVVVAALHRTIVRCGARAGIAHHPQLVNCGCAMHSGLVIERKDGLRHPSRPEATEYLGRLHSRCRMAKSLRLSHTVILDSSTAGLLSHVYRAWRLSSALTSNIIGTPYVQTEGQPVLRYSVSLPQSAPFSGRCLLPPYGTAWLTLMPVGRKPYHSIDSCGILSAVLLPRAAPFDMIKLSDLTEVRLIRQPAQPALRPLTRRSSSGNIPQYNQGREGPRPYGVPQYCK
jgi:hypothetical protein